MLYSTSEKPIRDGICEVRACANAIRSNRSDCKVDNPKYRFD